MIFDTENDFENQNFEFFEEVVDNFGRSETHFYMQLVYKANLSFQSQFEY